jgi:hypothetical protein
MSEENAIGSKSNAAAMLSSFNVNLLALVLALGLTVIGVKLTSFLPSRYYFSFSKLVDNTNSTTPFLISTPPYLAEDDLCKALDREPGLEKINCKAKEKDGSETGEEAYKKEMRLANRAVRQEAQAQDSFGNIIGLALRLLVPVLVGFFTVRVFGVAEELAASAGAAGGAILLCWPVIILWDLVVTKDFADQFGQFMLLYLLSAVAFFYMARIGAAFGRIMIDTKLLDVSFTKILQSSSSKIIESSLIALLSTIGIKFMESVVLKS